MEIYGRNSTDTDKVGKEIYSIYYDYEGDYTKPFSYFIGCIVKTDASVPGGMSAMTISGGTYTKLLAKGIA